jgi:hypothetical protein
MSHYLKKLDVSNDVFFEALEKSRNARDVNRAVFEKLVALEDFTTFKKMMIKRNLELQLEAMESLNHAYTGADADEEGMDSAGGRSAEEDEELERRLLADLALEDTLRKQEESSDEKEMAEILQQSLLELELYHRREAMEQLELEQALALSLLAEEERLERLRQEAKAVAAAAEEEAVQAELRRLRELELDAKASSKSEEPVHNISETKADAVVDAAPEVGAKAPEEAKGKQAGAKESASHEPEPVAASANASAKSSMEAVPKVDPSPGPARTAPALKPLRPVVASKALPPIVASSSSHAAPKGAALSPIPRNLDDQIDAFEERKRLAEEAFRKNQEIAAEQRRKEAELRAKIQNVTAATSTKAEGSGKPAESSEDERARYMREQRDRILAKKKAEREEKVRLEEERTRRRIDDGKMVAPEPDAEALKFIEAQKHLNKNESSSAEDEAERKRALMRRALAMNVKLDMLESSEAKMRADEEALFAGVDLHLQRLENHQKNASRRL